MIYLRILLLSIVAMVTSCEGQDRQANGEAEVTSMLEGTLVITSTYPLYFFASRLVEDVADAPEIVLPEIEGDPASWVPSAKQIQQLQSADAVILNGAGAESWLSLISIDRRRLVDTSAVIADRLIPLEASVLHQHGPEGDHSHQGTAFTTWLDPQLAILQAQSVTDALSEIAPSGEAGFRGNMAVLERDLVELDSIFAEIFSQLDGRPVLFSHPVYQYLQRRYGINGQSVHWEPGEAPSTSDWIALQQMRIQHPASLMIWEDEPLTSTVRRLSEAGIVSVPFRPVANRPIEGDYINVMRENAEQLKLILSSN